MLSCVSTQTAAEHTIEAVRGFNRFYTRQLGLLGKGLLGSAFSLTEARVLYELAHRDGVLAKDLARELQLDVGYLSRLLKRFEQAGYLTRRRSKSDARKSDLALTRAGRKAFGTLDRSARSQVASLIAPLSRQDRGALTEAMHCVKELLDPESAAPAVSLRAHQTGDIGWIAHRQGLLYAQEYGWDQTYEALVAEILAAFVKNFDPARERAFIAERDGAILGSVFLVRASDTVAKLRLLYVEPVARGLGLGCRLVNECVSHAREMGYQTLTLWTNDVLCSARKIYQATGFRLVNEERHHAFGQDLVGQTWELTL
jgi:DNA-binding MarR family transcriptional regulator/GNAT superfamily N-acetyltransferase